MTRRREVWVGISVAAAAALLLTYAIAVMVTFDIGDGKTDTRDAVVNPDAPFIPADRVPVLCYHYVRGPGGPLQFARVFGYVVLSLPLLDDSEIWKVSRRGFERQMQYLVARGYHTVTLDDVHEWQMGRRELPAQSVVITVDDGEESAYKYIYPV